MRLVFSFVVLLMLGGVAPAQSSLLSLLPPQTDFAVAVEHPQRLYDAIATHRLTQELQKLQAVREAYDTTNFRRLLQLLTHFEKELGVPGPELLERLAGGGIVFAGRFQDPPALLAVIEGKDARLVERFTELAMDVIGKELERQESRVKVERQKIAGLPGYKIDKLYVVRKEQRLFLASHPLVVAASLSAAGGKNLAGPLAQVRKQLPAGTLAWAWINLESARKQGGFKDGLNAVNMDPNATFLVGGLVSVLQRAPSLALALSRENENFSLVHRLGAGRDGMKARAHLFVPPDERGSLPLLEPPGVLASLSYYVDLKELWHKRGELFAAQQVKAMEEADKKSGPFLGGSKISTLLEQAGRYQRVVVTQPQSSPYKTRPETPLPAFAVVFDTRDSGFGKTLNTVFRGAALLASFKFNMKMSEEKHAGHELVCYRFDETRPLADDPKNVRLNFNPCFAAVGDQFIVSSTGELGRQLVELVAQEKREAFSPATTRIKLYGAGAAQALRAGQEQLLAQVVLNQALPPATARAQVDEFLRIVQGLGELLFEVRYGEKDFRHEVRWQNPR